MKSLRIAIVGCGKVADDHAEAVRFSDRAQLIACCDRSRLMAEQLAVRFAIPNHYDDMAAMLDEGRPDVVHITTPPQAHVELAVQAMEAGCHVFVEKPLALDEEQTRHLISVAEETGRLLTVGHSYWLDPAAIDLRELVATGRLGDIVHVESWYGYSLEGTYGKAIMSSPDNWVHDLPGKLFHNNIDHLLNKVLEFLPSPDVTVEARAFRRSPRGYGDRRDHMPDELRLYLEDPEGITAYATFTSAVKPVAQWIKVYGTEGTAMADISHRFVEISPDVSVPTALGRLIPAGAKMAGAARQLGRNMKRFGRSEFHHFSGLRRLIDEFHQSVLDGTEPPIPLHELLRMSRVQDDIWRQISDSFDGGAPARKAVQRAER